MEPVRLAIKVVPGASRTRVVGWLGDALKVAVSAPPESGKANEAVIELLAATAGVSASSVRIERGHTRTRKTVSIRGLPDHILLDRLGRANSR
jgi:uncharacterized protein (TIGR00251 family)